MKTSRPRLIILSSILSVVIALSVGLGLAYAMNTGMRHLPIKQYFDSSRTNAVWDWSNVTNKTDRELKEQATYLYLHQINTVYVDIGVVADMTPGDTSKKITIEQALDRYVNAMAQRNIRVFAAAGNTEWSKPDQRKNILNIQQFIFAYNDKHDKKLAGLEVDVESYNQPHFADASFTEKELVLLEFLDMADALADRHEQYVKTTGVDLELGFAIPYWFDNQNGNIKSVTWHEKTGPTLYHLLDRLNTLNRSNVVVMAYRNAALGNDGMIYHSRTEIEYARSQAPNVNIIIGLEVTDVEPEKITFYGRTFTEMSSEVKQIEGEYGAVPSYAGVAINDLQGLNELESTN